MNIERVWRVIATGICFAVFGIGGIAILCALFPALKLVPGPMRRQRYAKAVIHQGFRTFVAMMTRLGVISVEVRGGEKLARFGLFILANHPSLIDVVLLMSLVRRPDCVVKSALWRNPFTCGPVRFAGFINNAGGPALIDDCIASVARSNNLILFPEGTRTRPGESLQFQRGAANVAVRGPTAVTPVIISASEPTLTKGTPWYRVPQHRPHFTLTVLDDIDPATALDSSMDAGLAARRFTDWLQHYFTREIACRT
ncbi:Bifunctional protein Aas [Andreprevotia sp. IGB-42]|uniref:lysophospholipid acyltransferase family protein n=1 Tax=Andreprevotia sp. IGB-42 TaxID=2497473 RepID=UPI0013570D63|nr:lysophospholipid acyltransferase family protein [Andreprevotia sp. IGB-42]KAF0813778.1 Bifunctional protein Aas [Andreprevotia sp. IGB-42]